MQIFEATPENLRKLQGHTVHMNSDEGILVVKLTAITPRILAESDDISTVVDGHPGYIFTGNMSDIEAAVNGSFASMAEQYAAAVKEFNNEPKEQEDQQTR